MHRLAKDPGNIEFNLYALNFGPNDYDEIERTRKKLGISNERLTLSQVSAPQRRSVGHGQAVNLALSTIKTNNSDVNVIMDADTYVLVKHWDVATRIILSDTGAGLFGTTYENQGDLITGPGNVQTYKGIPNVVWVGLRPGVAWNELDASPQKGHRPRLSGDEARIFGLRDGQYLLKNVCWQLPQFIYDRDLRSTQFAHVRPASPDAIVFSGVESDIYEEYHLNGIPFVAHQTGAIKFRYNSDPESIRFYSAVNAYIQETQDKPVPDWHQIITKRMK